MDYISNIADCNINIFIINIVQYVWQDTRLIIDILNGVEQGFVMVMPHIQDIFNTRNISLRFKLYSASELQFFTFFQIHFYISRVEFFLIPNCGPQMWSLAYQVHFDKIAKHAMWEIYEIWTSQPLTAK